MTLQRRLNAAVYKNNFPVAINCHYVSTIPFFFFLILFSCFAAFFSPTDSWFSRWKLTNLNNFPNSVDISLSRLWQKRSCTRQMQFFHECLPSQHGVYNHRLQSADVSCPNRARTHRSDCQNRVCNHPKRGTNQQSHLASSETLSNLDFVHSTDLVTGQVDFSACSSCKLKTKWGTDNCYFLVFIGLIFFENAFSNFLTKIMMSYEEINKIRIIVFPWHFVRGSDGF